MIHKSISLALCITTFVSSVSWSMEPVITDLTTSEPKTLSLRPIDAFHVSHSSTQQTLQGNLTSDVQQAFAQGLKDGFRSYVDETKRFLSAVYNRDINQLGENTIRTIVQDSLGTSLRKYQHRNDSTQLNQEIDADTLKEIFTMVREGLCKALLKTGAFGSSKLVFILERQTTETHYDVTLGMAASFLDAVLPNSLPLKGAFLSLVNNSQINSFILKQLDGLFARYTTKYFEALTGQKITSSALKSLEIVGLSGAKISRDIIKSALADYPNADQLPVLTTEDAKFSELWKFISPRLTHYLRLGLRESFVGISGLSADKISDTVTLEIVQTISNQAPTINFTAGAIGYYVGELLTSIPLLDGLVGVGLACWTSNGLLRAAMPRGLDEARRKVVQNVMENLELTATFYINQFLPISRAEHCLYGLNSNPSETELALFRADYEERDRLTQQSFMMSLMSDVASAAGLTLSQALEATGIPYLVRNLIGTTDNKDQLSFIQDTQSTTHAQANHKDTVARVQLYELAKALGDIESQKETFDQTARWYDKALAYWKGKLPDQIELTDDQQQLLDSVRKHPSFDLLKAELDHLSKHYTWLSQDDKETKLKAYEDQRTTLSDGFIKEANEVLAKIAHAKQALADKVKDVDKSLKDLMNGLSFDHFVIALDALGNQSVVEQFDFNRPITDLPAFAVAVADYKDLLESHPDLVSLLQTSSLGMMQTLKYQLETARKLSQFTDAANNLKALMYKPTNQAIAEIESPGLHQRYTSYINNYIASVYGPKFLDTLSEERVSLIVGEFSPIAEKDDILDDQYTNKCMELLNSKEDFMEFRNTLKKSGLLESQRTAVYKNILQSLMVMKRRLDQDKKSESDIGQSEKQVSSSSLFNLFRFGSTKTGGQLSSNIDKWKDVGSSTTPSQNLHMPEQSVLVSIKEAPLETLENDGFEAYFLATVIKEMIKKNADVFDGRSWSELTPQDMIKVAGEIDAIRLSKITSSDDLLLIERHKQELAGLIQAEHTNSVIWTYESALNQLHQKALDAINTVQNPQALGKHTIIDDYVSSLPSTSSGSTESENRDPQGHEQPSENKND